MGKLMEQKGSFRRSVVQVPLSAVSGQRVVPSDWVWACCYENWGGREFFFFSFLFFGVGASIYCLPVVFEVVCFGVAYSDPQLAHVAWGSSLHGSLRQINRSFVISHEPALEAMQHGLCRLFCQSSKDFSLPERHWCRADSSRSKQQPLVTE